MQIMSVVPQLQTVLHWTHVEGGQAHCLVRICRHSEGTTVILSEIRSNDRARALMLDLEGAANALAPRLISMEPDPAAVKWLIHYGSFSDYEPLQRESWAQAAFTWSGNCYVIDWANWKTLQAEQINALKQTIDLASVLDVLKVIGWTHR